MNPSDMTDLEEIGQAIDDWKVVAKKERVRQQAELREESRTTKQLDAYRMVYEKTDRIMSGLPVRVRIDNSPPSSLQSAPGWTDGETVSLNGAIMKEDMQKHSMESVILRSRAINYHELCHILYTPRDEDAIVRWIVQQTKLAAANNEPWRHLLWTAFNFLEDQRIEMLFTSRYKSSIPYFRAAVLRWLIGNKGKVQLTHLLIHGRKFLGKKTRRAARAAFVDAHSKELAEQADVLIDKYLKVSFPTTVFRAQTVVSQFAQLLHEVSGGMHDLLPGQSSGGHSIGNNLSKPYDGGMTERAPSTSAQREALAAMEEQEEEWEADDADDDASGSGGADEDGEGSGDDGDDDGADGESGGESQSDQHGDGAGSGAADLSQLGEADAEATEQFYNDLKCILDDDSFQKELSNIAKTVRDVMNEQLDVIDGKSLESKSRSITPAVAAVSAAASMGVVLQQLRNDLEEEHINRQSAGTLDMKRITTRLPWETDIFKTYEPGNFDEAKVETVILCDFSGSMSRIMEEVSVAMWTLRRALDGINGRTTVMGYDEGVYSIFQPTDETPRDHIKVYPSMGGTDPTEALKVANQVFTRSSYANKLLITITDGHWDSSEDVISNIMTSIHGAGVTSCLLELATNYMGVSTSLGHRHSHLLYLIMESISQLPDVGMKLVTELMRTVTARV